MNQEEEEIIERMKNRLIQRYYAYKYFESKGLGADPEMELEESQKSAEEYLRNIIAMGMKEGKYNDTIDYCRRMIVALLRTKKQINNAEKEEPEK